MTANQHDRDNRELSPRFVRVIVFTILIAIAIASIALIDARAMQRQGELEEEHRKAKELQSHRAIKPSSYRAVTVLKHRVETRFLIDRVADVCAIGPACDFVLGA